MPDAASSTDPPPKDLFPVDPWAIETTQFTGEYVQQAETVFALANGYLGLRGSHEEDHPIGEAGTYLNGFYELRPIIYGETAYGFPQVGQTMLNCPDGKIVKLYVDDEPFDVEKAEIDSYSRRLDMRKGTLVRDIVWSMPGGKRIRIRSTRFVSLANRHLAAMQFEITPLGSDANLTVWSRLVNRQALPEASSDPRLGQGLESGALAPVGRWSDDYRSVFSFRTRRSGLTLGCGIDHAIETESPYTVDTQVGDDFAAVEFKVQAHADEPVRISKFLAYHYSDVRPPEEMLAQTAWTLDKAMEEGFPALLSTHEMAVADFWERSDVIIDGAPETQQIVRWNLFQLMQASACVEGLGIGARGLTGQAYEGHYFWDTEIYVMAFLIYSNPRVARGLLKHRYDMLDQARARARELGHRGALFPWRTINGDEASAYYAASTAQYHINADIMYAVRKYVDITGDTEFLKTYGAEMLVETARLWVDLGFYSEERKGLFCIDGVTGPDEYTAIVNNNFFTNLMAQENLRYAAEIIETLGSDDPKAYAALKRKTDLTEEEPGLWRDAAEAMYLPYDEARRIHPQDDSFLEKEVWDFENTPEDKFPLLLHFHPLNLYRHQVIKQADTILALFLMGHRFDLGEKKRNFDYYDPLTTHDSSLSVCVQSAIASEIGYAEKALEYFDFAANMDLSNVGGNVHHGAHIASIGGSWMALVHGFGGLRDSDGQVRFRPRPPKTWSSLQFRLQIADAALDVRTDAAGTRYRLRSGDSVRFYHEDVETTLTAAQPEVHYPTMEPVEAAV